MISSSPCDRIDRPVHLHRQSAVTPGEIYHSIVAILHIITKVLSSPEPPGRELCRADLSSSLVLVLAGIIVVAVLGLIFRLLARIGRRPIGFLSRNLRLKLAISYFLTAFIPIFLFTLGALIAFYIFTGGYRSGLAKQTLFNEASRLSELAEHMAAAAGRDLSPEESDGRALPAPIPGEGVEFLVIEEPGEGDSFVLLRG